jgi:rhodanese-related sulfurtransferase
MGFLIIVLLLIAVGWDIAWWIVGVKPMSPWRLGRILRSQRDDYTLVDIRTDLEYRWFRIEGVPNYPKLLKDPDGLSLEDPTKPVVIICMSGHRSPVAGYRLKHRGFKDVSYAVWGLIGWWIAARKS